MSIITPSRGDLLIPQNPFFPTLQPSAMPHPPPTASPKRPLGSSLHPLPFLRPPPLLDNSRLNALNASSSYGSGITWKTAKTNTSREALIPLNTNSTAYSTSTISTSKPSINTRLAVPKASIVPDVFAAAPIPDGTSNSTRQSLSKRSRDVENLPTSLPPKRLKADDSGTTALVVERLKGKENMEERLLRAKAEADSWRDKWLKHFPGLVFHFELGSEEGQGRALMQRVLKMNARVDQFFSSKVTHLIVKGNGSPQKPRIPTKRDSVKDSPSNPFRDPAGGTGLAAQAEKMNIKVWTLKKLSEVLSKLAPPNNPLTRAESLHTLLEDERLHGTRERDFTAPRPDFYYFKTGCKYLLVEDAINKHRPILVKEYNTGKDGPEYPVLYETFLRPSSGSQNGVPPEKVRERAWALYVRRKSYEGEHPPGELRRSTSLRAFPDTPKLPEPSAYQAASGNSQIITSNTASTSTANYSPLFPDNFQFLNRNRGIAQLSRVQVLKGNANKRNFGNLHINQRRATTGADSLSSKTYPTKTFMTQDQVVRMLQQARAPVNDDGSITHSMRTENAARVRAGGKSKDQQSTAGYCENCRLRYDELSNHVKSKRHRRFALCADNFRDLDLLLYSLRRPLHPSLLDAALPPCRARHGQYDPCDACDVEYNGESLFDDADYEVDDDQDVPSETRGESASDGFVEEDESGGEEEDDVEVREAGTSEDYGNTSGDFL